MDQDKGIPAGEENQQPPGSAPELESIKLLLVGDSPLSSRLPSKRSGIGKKSVSRDALMQLQQEVNVDRFNRSKLPIFRKSQSDPEAILRSVGDAVVKHKPVIAAVGDKLEPIAEEITDLLCKPLTISPTASAAVIATSTCTDVESPTTAALAKSVRALSVNTPATAEGDNDNQHAHKRPSDPNWSFGGSPTSSRPRPSKRCKKSISCDVLVQDIDIAAKVGSVPGVVISRTLHKSQSDPAAIMRAIQQSETDPLLIGDSSRRYVLPIMTAGTKHSDLKEISPETLLAVLKGEYASQLGSYQIIDCRYPYEFEGGHIEGAVNLYTQRQVHDKFLANRANVEAEARDTATANILIFHCEFSSQRAPNMCRFVRDIDRTLNKDHYPALHYPELYILNGGYKLFFELQPGHCIPSAYLPMADDGHGQELSHYKNKAREELIKASTGGGRTVSHSHLLGGGGTGNGNGGQQRKTKSFNRLCF